MPRIVSLIASATEIVCALGYEDALVGRSHECDYPESVRRLPVCTAPKFDIHGSSADIDRRVKEIVGQALSVYHVDEPLLRELEPDVIVTQSQCEVCAVSLRDVERAVCAWLSRCPRLVSLLPNALADVWDDIEKVAVALDAADRGAELIARLKGRLAAIARQALALPYRPRVACVEWADPLMAAGNWVPELVAMAGGVSVFGEAGKHAPALGWEQLVAADPDVMILMPCGYDLNRTMQDVPLLAERPGWQSLRAVRTGRVFATDGNQYFNRPGPRLVESLEILAEILHPGEVRYGHEGTGWQRVVRPAEELVDVLDEQGRTVGVVSRREMRQWRLPHRCVYLLVFNRRGELFIHQRTPTKDVYPSSWDVCAGGVLAAGESFDEAAAREGLEELGVELKPEPLFPFLYEDERTTVRAVVYRAVHDGPFRLQPEEIVRGEFVTPAALDAVLAERTFCPDGRMVLAAYRARTHR